MSNIFIVSWDCTGIEAVLDLTDYEKERTWAILQDQTPPSRLNEIMGHLLLRARANPQRHYEIYTMQVEEGITDKDVREMFEQDPQGSADLIRKRGTKIYSDRVNIKERLIV